MRNKLICVIIFVLLSTAIVPNFIYATNLDDYDINFQSYNDVTQSYSKDSFDLLSEEGKSNINYRAGSRSKDVISFPSLGGTLASALASIFYIPATVASFLMTLVARQGNTIDWSSKSKINWYTIEDTVYNKIALFDAEYFISEANDNEFNVAIKNAVAIFYYITKTIAVLFGVIMLIYLGIRMALSTIASEMAKYKEMLKDWLISMILIFAMPYIIGIINLIASSLVQIFASIAPKSFEQNLILQVLNLVRGASGWSYVAVVCMYLVITIYQIKFFLMYTKRMLSMGFLIVISPLITITYSATKTPISKGGSNYDMFNNWFKEYMVNAFIQPLHAALYLIFVISAHEIFTVAPFLSLIMFMGLSRGEKIMKNIFGMRKMTSINSMSEYMPIKKKN